ncbi:hypothetical protein TRFO_33513 [Tritrichomonas foetus]|uniref:Uncharacterized protein n=1 Tax=Tritrichomonas foetus TaxID=1144522 RepID=A0A1J4JRS3_9EUKA|nr:hypothetical protein TRFO_33513 [Tritrichomonas foetus]|eukprot:OHS99948.1 hypothetical protein TRFO_33513 [Tritrichomonas foetus]
MNKYPDDFTFIVNGKKYQTNRFIAGLLSPKISQLHFTDESINEYNINTQNPGDFDDILSFVNFEPKLLSKNDILFISEIFRQLGNDEYFKIYSNYQETLTIDNVLSRLEDKLLFSRSTFHPSLNLFDCSFLDEEISFISKHFCDIIQDEQRKPKYNFQTGEKINNNERHFHDLDIEILEIILQNPNLKLYNEDFLFDFIFSLFEKSIDNSKCLKLFENVKFEYLSANSIEKFISIFDFEDITKPIWSSICQRLLLTPSTDKNENDNNNRYTSKIIQIPYKNTINEGLFHYLREKYSNDPYDYGIVEITASSVVSDSQEYQPKNSINLFDDNNNIFESKDLPNQWICYKFNNFHFKLLKYQIRTWDFEVNFHHLRNWVIETSNDGNKWNEIDQQKNCKSLNSNKNSCIFHVKSSSSDFVQFIRLRQIGHNWYDKDYLIFNSIEFYGELME